MGARKKIKPSEGRWVPPAGYQLLPRGGYYVAVYLLGATLADDYRELTEDGSVPALRTKPQDLKPIIKAHQEQQQREKQFAARERNHTRHAHPAKNRQPVSSAAVPVLHTPPMTPMTPMPKTGDLEQATLF